jgi:acyl-CoA reductase-like NAD-dependent aldehyde dehydrogenase
MPTTVDEATGLQIVPLWINGLPAKASPEATFPVYSSRQQKKVYLAQSADVPAAILAAESAQNAFRGWRYTPAVQRRNIILRLAALLKERKDQLVRLQIEETSCSETWASFNIVYTLNMLGEIAARITTVCTGEVPPMASEGTFGLLVKEPIGVVLLIAP